MAEILNIIESFLEDQKI